MSDRREFEEALRGLGAESVIVLPKGTAIVMEYFEHTFALIKPDVVKAQRVGHLLSMIEDEHISIRGMRLMVLSAEDLAVLYREHVEKPFYPEFSRFMQSAPSIALVLQGEDVVSKWRAMMGPTDSSKAPRGTIRSRFGSLPIYRNAVHGSDSPEAAAREIAHFFPVMHAAMRDEE